MRLIACALLAPVFVGSMSCSDHGKSPGQVRLNRKDGQRYAWIPPGNYRMGCSPGDAECYESEKPAHNVTISNGFWMGQTAVTVGAYKRYAQAGGKAMPPGVARSAMASHRSAPMTCTSATPLVTRSPTGLI